MDKRKKWLVEAVDSFSVIKLRRHDIRNNDKYHSDTH
jgi:hypothetical protein